MEHTRYSHFLTGATWEGAIPGEIVEIKINIAWADQLLCSRAE